MSQDQISAKVPASGKLLGSWHGVSEYFKHFLKIQYGLQKKPV
jgi:hypothetical protein